MPRFDIIIEGSVSRSPRARQLEGLFDVPPAEKQRLEWHGELPIEKDDWNVGLICGPSGSGKSVLARKIFGENLDVLLEWKGQSVIDDFSAKFSMEDIAKTCSAVGFNTIPSWLRPFRVLSNGEQFRVSLARRLLECQDPIVVDEFTSVVDRQVAKIGAHAVQKYIRKNKKHFVAVSCHSDIIDWLEPDWIYWPGENRFERRLLQGRPKIEVIISAVPYSAWKLFAPYHYMSAELNRSARCYGLFVGNQIVAFTGILSFPHKMVKDIRRCSRLVTIPDWQGLGLAFILIDNLSAAYKSLGYRMRCYPAHPSFIRSYDRSDKWRIEKKPGNFSGKSTKTKMGGRPCAIFEYIGPSLDKTNAEKLIAGQKELSATK